MTSRINRNLQALAKVAGWAFFAIGGTVCIYFTSQLGKRFADGGTTSANQYEFEFLALAIVLSTLVAFLGWCLLRKVRQTGQDRA